MDNINRAIVVFTACIAVFFTKANAQDNMEKSPLNKMLQSYYAVKDALVNDSSSTASASATAYIKNANGISYQIISEGNVSALIKDASAIADAKDINKQREHFAYFSSNMLEIVKVLDVTDQPVYIQYCPMKKSSWLSKEEAIKNPYYGSAMLTCGNVTDTIE